MHYEVHKLQQFAKRKTGMKRNVSQLSAHSDMLL